MATEAVNENVTVEYAAGSALKAGEDGSRLMLSLDARRGTVGVRGRVKDPLLMRDALGTVAAILGSDLRYRHRDRAQYLAYLAQQGQKATKEIWEAQKAFLDEQFGEDKRTSSVLDPVMTVDPDEVSLEVFSRDESAWARLAFANELFEKREAGHGTACVDLSEAAVDSLDRLRTWLPVTLEAGTQLDRSGLPARDVKDRVRDLEVPRTWLRGFLQVQSAATLPGATCELAAIDLYNLLFAMRTRRAKNPPRALRFELVPGQPPRMVLEPWEIVLEGHGAPYAGRSPRVIRTFGRQRLVALARLLPHVKRVRVQLIGQGLPQFWVLDLGVASLSLALTGWAETGWSSAAHFDALVPPAGAAKLADGAHRVLTAEGPHSFADLGKKLGAKAEELRAALQLECMRGRVLVDLAKGTFRPRALLAKPIPDEAMRFGSEREARAHRLLGDGVTGGQVRITKLHEIAGEGTEIHGEIEDREAQRSFATRFLLDPEGRVREARCNCPHHKRSGLREGPCEHLLALRLLHGREKALEEARRGTPDGRKLIRAETRTWVRRDHAGKETVYRLSLDGKLVQVQWGERTDKPRDQRLWHDSDDDARDAYFARQEALAAQGFVDADANA